MVTAEKTVRFHYCISFVFLTWYRESDPIWIKPGQSVFLAALPYNLITALLGWWGLPWGIFLTPLALYRNLFAFRVQFRESST